MLALASKGIAELMKKALITGHHYHSTGMQVTLSIMQPSAESSCRYQIRGRHGGQRTSFD